MEADVKSNTTFFVLMETLIVTVKDRLIRVHFVITLCIMILFFFIMILLSKYYILQYYIIQYVVYFPLNTSHN